jgi:hypothetical protein
MLPGGIKSLGFRLRTDRVATRAIPRNSENFLAIKTLAKPSGPGARRCLPATRLSEKPPRNSGGRGRLYLPTPARTLR